MAESRKQRCQARLGQLKTERASFESSWRELGEYFLPQMPRFLATERNKGDRRNTKIINNTPTLSAETLGSGMHGGMTSPARPWFTLATADNALMEIGAVQHWLYEVQQRMNTVFSRSNLYQSLPVMYANIGVFGTSAMAVLEDPDTVIRTYPYPIGSFYLANGPRLTVDTCYREFSMTVRQLVQEYGIDNVSTNVRSMYESGTYEVWIEVVHAIEPNLDRDAGKLDAKSKAFISVYYEKGGDADKVLRESGFDEFPVMAPRWFVNGEDVYATRCPGMTAIGDNKALQLEERRKAQAIDKLVDPPMVGPSSLKNQRASLLPGDVTYVDAQQGMQGFVPAYQINPRLNELMLDIQANEDRIRRAFFVDLFLMLSNMGNPKDITATAILELKEEKLVVLGPVLQRLDEDLLDPLISRTFAIMQRRGLIPELPEELANQELKVEYVSVMAQAQKMAGIGGVERFMGFVGNLAGAKPEVLDKVDFDQAVDDYGQRIGLPPGIVVPDAQVAKVRQQRAQQQQAAQAMQMAQVAAQGAKTLSDTDTGGQNALSALMGGIASV